MKKRFLIVVGLPKSGTTFIYSQFQRQPEHFNLPATRKEIDFFRGANDLERYLAEFATHDNEKVFLDASPLYIDDVVRTAGNIRAALKGHEVRILVCLREPLERAYSHYLHDVAQNHKINCHADFNFLSPPVLGKYLFPLAERVRFLRQEFGAENVFGFSFEGDNTRFTSEIKSFANLPDDWKLDFGHNPAPGFTSPQVLYNPEKDTTIVLNGQYYRLPAGRLLVVNRQYSVYRHNINRQIGDAIMHDQALVTRSFNTGILPEKNRQNIAKDYSQAASLLDLDLPVSIMAKVHHSHLSDDLPEDKLKQLEHLGDVGAACDYFYEDPLRSTSHTIIGAPDYGPSLARMMARFTLAATDPKAVSGLGTREAAHDIVEAFGPVPLYIEFLLRHLIRLGHLEEALALVEPYGGSDGLVWPVDVSAQLAAKGKDIPEGLRERFEKLKLIR